MIDAAHAPTFDGGSQFEKQIALGVVSASVLSAASLLFEAFRLATNVGRSRWDFAVGLDELTRHGVANSAVRWLACKGYIRLARETTQLGDNERTFRRQSSTCLSARTCAAITKKGRQFARELQGTAQLCDGVIQSATESRTQADEDALPNWDSQRAQLRFGRVVIKQFRKSAPIQSLILAVFEEEGWPPRIDDPLPPSPEKDPQRRLLDAIKTLNEGHKHRIIRFCGDGTGRGVKWEFIQGTESTTGVRQSSNGSAARWKDLDP